MALESTVAVAIAAFFLSLAGIPATATGDFLYLSSFRRALQVQIGIFDWASFLLLDFFYVFATWTFITVSGGQLRTSRYVMLGGLGFLVVFMANGLKVFVQVYFAAISGAFTGGYENAALASMDAFGLVAMFGVVLSMVACTCLFLSVGARGSLGWFSGILDSGEAR